MAQRFGVEGFNQFQPLTGGGAEIGPMGMKAFEAKPEVMIPRPSSPVPSGPEV